MTSDQKQFPIMGGRTGGGNDPRKDFTIPWSLLAPHEARAILNHSQTLDALARRGGIDAIEALAIIEDQPLRTFLGRYKREEAEALLRGLVAQS